MNRVEATRRAKALVAQMSVEEKASQLRFDAPAIERLGIPAYNWWNEALHGVARAGTATVFPQAIGMAAAFDPALLQEVGDAIADEARAKYNEQSKRGDRDIYKGITLWSPNVNIFRDPRWGRGHETYGEDPYLTSRLGVAFVKGLQGNGEYLHTAACAKHFAVHSGPEAERHHFNAIVSAKDLEETYLPAFEACVKEGKVEAVMGAYNRTNGEVCCGSPTLQKILRNEWKFEGHFVSDCWAIRDFHEHHHVTESAEDSARLALENGTDVNCGCVYQKILDAYHDGKITEEQIDRSAIRLFTTRFLLGMFDETSYDSIPYTVVESRRHLELEDRIAKEGIVLLKNDGVLPIRIEDLKKSANRTIGVIGPNADSRSALIGNYHGTSSRYITILEGIQDAVLKGDQATGTACGQECDGEIRVLYSQGCDLSADNVEPLSAPEMADRLAEAKTVVDYSDLVIVVIGLDETQEGEEGDDGNAYFSGDKKNLKIPPFQYEMVREVLTECHKCDKPVVVINVSGSALDLSICEEQADAVVQAFYPGARGGKNVADLLFGLASPSGKLPVTFYLDDENPENARLGNPKLPAFTDYSMKERTYRYYSGTPLYPFGYGLTYGDCWASAVSIKAPESGLTYDRHETDPTAEDVVLVSVTVQNDGAETDDVLQVYVEDARKGHSQEEEGPLHPSLAGFARVHLEKDEHRVVTIPVRARAFTSVDENGIRAIRSNTFTVYAGFSQPDKRSASLTGHSCGQAKLEL